MDEGDGSVQVCMHFGGVGLRITATVTATSTYGRATSRPEVVFRYPGSAFTLISDRPLITKLKMCYSFTPRRDVSDLQSQVRGREALEGE